MSHPRDRFAQFHRIFGLASAFVLAMSLTLDSAFAAIDCRSLVRLVRDLEQTPPKLNDWISLEVAEQDGLESSLLRSGIRRSFEQLNTQTLQAILKKIPNLAAIFAEDGLRIRLSLELASTAGHDIQESSTVTIRFDPRTRDTQLELIVYMDLMDGVIDFSGSQDNPKLRQWLVSVILANAFSSLETTVASGSSPLERRQKWVAIMSPLLENLFHSVK
jgi:hypothetical protein